MRIDLIKLAVLLQVATDEENTSSVDHVRKANTASNVNRNSSLKALYPCVRFVPKKTSMRAITNMKSMPCHTTTAYNIPAQPPVSTASSASATFLPHTLTNASLYNVLHVLRHLHQHHHPSACGFGVLGVEEACKRFKRYRLHQQAQQLVRRDNSDQRPESALDDYSECPQIQQQQQQQEEEEEQPYYVAVLDLEKCFDRVDTARLYDVVEGLVRAPSSLPAQESSSSSSSRGVSSSSRGGSSRGDSSRGDSSSNGGGDPHRPPAAKVPEEHLIHKYSVSMFLPSSERFVSRSIRSVAPADDFQSFQEASELLADSHHNSILSDGVVYPSLSREDLLKIVRQHLFQHAVRMPDESRRKRQRSSESDLLYTQVRGIPQGSALSPLLCNLYYGHVERDTFGSGEEMESLGLTDMSSLIVRVMDDYLMISTQKKAVVHFLQRAHTCFKPFGGGFNPSKTKVNFDATLDVDGRDVLLPRMSGPVVTWCGFSINHTTLEISPSFSKLFGSGVEHSVTRGCNHAGVAFRKALKGFIRPKFQAIILDSSINKFITVTKSIYSLFLTAAVRTDIYLRKGANSLRLSLENQNVAFVCACICDVVQYGARLVTLRNRQDSRKDSKQQPTGDSSTVLVAPLSWSDVTTFQFHHGTCSSSKCTQLCSLSPNQVSYPF